MLSGNSGSEKSKWLNIIKKTSWMEQSGPFYVGSLTGIQVCHGFFHFLKYMPEGVFRRFMIRSGLTLNLSK
jgi:hypothetical protein